MLQKYGNCNRCCPETVLVPFRGLAYVFCLDDLSACFVGLFAFRPRSIDVELDTKGRCEHGSGEIFWYNPRSSSRSLQTRGARRSTCTLPMHSAAQDRLPKKQDGWAHSSHFVPSHNRQCLPAGGFSIRRPGDLFAHRWKNT